MSTGLYDYKEIDFLDTANATNVIIIIITKLP